MTSLLNGLTLLLAILATTRANAQYTSDDLLDYSLLGDVEIVSIIVESGVFLNDRDEHGQSALMLAAAEGHTQLVEVLIAGEADVDARDNEGTTAFCHALLAQQYDIAYKLQSLTKETKESCYSSFAEDEESEGEKIINWGYFIISPIINGVADFSIGGASNHYSYSEEEGTEPSYELDFDNNTTSRNRNRFSLFGWGLRRGSWRFEGVTSMSGFDIREEGIGNVYPNHKRLDFKYLEASFNHYYHFLNESPLRVKPFVGYEIGARNYWITPSDSEEYYTGISSDPLFGNPKFRAVQSRGIVAPVFRSVFGIDVRLHSNMDGDGLTLRTGLSYTNEHTLRTTVANPAVGGVETITFGGHWRWMIGTKWSAKSISDFLY